MTLSSIRLNSTSPAGALPTSKQRILIPQILSHVRLMKNNNTRRVQLSRIHSTPSRNPKAQCYPTHTQYYDTSVLGGIVGDTA